MKILREGINGKGKRQITLTLDEGEVIRAFKPDEHYKLGEPMQDDVIVGDILIGATRTYWASDCQKWIE